MPAPAPVPVLSGIGPLMERYDGVILDLWGVVHDGRRPYPGATETLARLQAAGKPVVMLSNAPRRAAAVIDGMTAIGIDRALYTDVLSSGELAWRALRDRPDGWLRALGRRCLHIGPERDRGLLDGLALTRIEAPAAGAFILNTGPWRDEETLADYEDVLAAAARLGLPMICANPDMEVIRGGARIICAGTLAARYAELGGDLRSYGKPFPETYDACVALMGMGGAAAEPPFFKSAALGAAARLVAIGDSFATDMRGANGAGIDAVFVTSGIHGAGLGVAFGEMPDGARLAAAAARAGVHIAAAVPAFRW